MMVGKGVWHALKQVAGATAVAALLFSGGLAPSAGLDGEGVSEPPNGAATATQMLQSPSESVATVSVEPGDAPEPPAPSIATPTAMQTESVATDVPTPAASLSEATADVTVAPSVAPSASQVETATPKTEEPVSAGTVQPEAATVPFAVNEPDATPPYIRWTAATVNGHLVGGASFTLERESCGWFSCSWGSAVTVQDCVAASPTGCTGADKDPDVGEFTVTGLATGRYGVRQSGAEFLFEGIHYQGTSTQRVARSLAANEAVELPSFTQVPSRLATVQVNTADIRTATTNSGFRADHAVGARFGLFTSESSGSPVATCEVVSSNGVCAFNVQVSGGPRMWVGALKPAPGSIAAATYGDPITQLTTGTNNGFTDRSYRYQTDRLYAGSTYTVPGDSWSGTGWNATSTQIVSRLANPSLGLTCSAGVKVALVMDLSGSIADAGAQDTLKAAALGMVDSLSGTGSSMALFSFGNTSPRENTGNLSDLRALDVPAQRQQLLDAIDNYRSWTRTNQGTNWDAALLAASGQAQNYDIVIVLTDGNPTFSNLDGSGNSGGSGSLTTFREVERAVMSANVIKSKGARVMAVGVGGNLSEHNLAAISGPQKYETGHSLNDVDYSVAEWGKLGSLLKEFARGLSCQAEVIVEKEAGDTVETAELAEGWEFSAVGAGVASVSPATVGTTSATGAVAWNLAFSDAASEDSVTLTELSTDPAWHLAALECTVNGAPVQVTVAKSVTIAGVGVGDTVKCTFTNVKTSALEVAKLWVINGTEYPHGEQPEGFDAALTLTGPGAAGATAQEWDEPRTGYTAGEQVTIVETTSLPTDRPGCVLESSLIRAAGATGAGADVTAGHTVALRSGVNAYVITNTVNCTTLTLVKELEHNWGGTSEVSDWVLTATPSGGSAVVLTSGEAVGVEPGEHTVAEALRPEKAALAAGYEFSHIRCVADENVLLEGAPDAVSLAVTVPAGTDTVCVLTNTDKPGSLEWLKVDEQQRPLAGSIWELTGPDGTVVEVTDLAGEQGQGPDTAPEAGTFRLADLAWGTYQLREKQAPAGYRLAEGSVEFTVGPEGDGLDVTFEKAFVNEPHDTVVLPLTGGTARDTFTLAGGGLLAGALLLGLVLRRRKGAPVQS